MTRILLIFLGNFFILLFTNYFLLFLTGMLVNQTLIWKRKVFLFLGINALFSSLISLASLLDLYQAEAQLSIWTYGAVIFLQLFSGYLLIKKFYNGVSSYGNFFIQSISTGLLYVVEYVLLSLFIEYLQQLPEILILFAAIPLTLVQVAVAIFVCYLLRKTQIVAAIKKLLDYKRFIAWFTGLFFLSDILFYLIFFFDNNRRENNAFILSLAYLVLLVIFALWAFAIDKDSQWRYSESLLAQQRSYIRQIEAVQKELKSIQHDYKNIIAGIYLHAHEGNTDEIQKYLSEKLFKIDYQIEEKIKQQNQLLLINNIEIKGLIMAKQAIAETKKCQLFLEVSDEINVIPMDTTDLLRILGIFLDNAIEASIENKTTDIHLVFLQESDSITILIKNTILTDLKISEVLKPGFSTKGKGRGTGLSNARNILSNYPSAFHQISIKNEQFIQTLTIQK